LSGRSIPYLPRLQRTPAWSDTDWNIPLVTRITRPVLMGGFVNNLSSQLVIRNNSIR